MLTTTNDANIYINSELHGGGRKMASETSYLSNMPSPPPTPSKQFWATYYDATKHGIPEIDIRRMTISIIDFGKQKHKFEYTSTQSLIHYYEYV